MEQARNFKNRFRGRIRKKSPKSLIKDSDNSSLDNFFLTLGLIFNDMKDIVLFQELLNEKYEPAGSKIDAHNGEVAGVNVHIIRIFSGLILEFLNFLSKNGDVVKSEDFLDLLDRLPVSAKKTWKFLISVSLMKKNENNPTNYALMRIRNNLTYHYEDAGKCLRIGFIEKFYYKKKDRQNKNSAAYYSLEDLMATTRFYYVDAAAEEYMMKISNGWDDYRTDIRGLIDTMNYGFYSLMNVYLRGKPDIN